MGTFTEVITKLFRPYKRIFLILVLLVIFITVGVYGYRRFYKPRTAINDVANANRRDKELEVILFTVDWCPHCKTAKPEWSAFQEQYNGQVVNGYTIKCTSIDCTDAKDPEIQNMCSTYNIDSYPTVKMLKGDQHIDFDAKVKTTNLSQFVETMTQN